MTSAAPDGDASLEGAEVAGFRVACCRRCHGTLKPDVVFFGENVPRERVQRAWRLFEAADLLLVAGSSLTVWSGYRFVRRASEEGVPVAIVNRGRTRADTAAQLKVDDLCGRALPDLASLLLGSEGRRS